MVDESLSERFQWKDAIDITKEQWINLLEEKDLITERDARLLTLIYSCTNYKATASQLAQILNMPHHAPLNSQVGHLGKRIVKRLNILAPKQRDGEGFNWWHVPFLGEQRKEGCYWILRPELKEAMEEVRTGEAFLLELKLPEEVDSDSYENLYEGAKKQIYVNSYERSRGARDQCVRHYGARCIICGFDFEKVYGEVGRDVIHVHHLKPLSDVGETYKVSPINDLRPVCPNCHIIIHKKNPPCSIEEVMIMLKKQG